MSQVRENYLGNPNLKRSNVAQDFTEEQIKEFVKCSQDPYYFITKYIQIVNIDEGLIPFKPYDFQKDIIELVKDRSFIWTPFFGYEKWDEINDFSSTLSQHNEMFSPINFEPVGNHLDQSGHDFIYKKVKEFLNGVN